MRREEYTGKITDGAIVCGGGEGKRRWRDSIKHHLREKGQSGDKTGLSGGDWQIIGR